jgi:nucleoside-diphosphate-sugar epimerase
MGTTRRSLSGLKTFEPLGQPISIRIVDGPMGQTDRLPGHCFDPMFEQRAIVDREERLTDVDTIVRIDSDQMGVKRSMMNLGQRQSIGHHWLTSVLVLVADDVGGVEQSWLWHARNRTASIVGSAGAVQGMTGFPEDDHRVLDAEATVSLARAAQRAGVRRFVFLSSIRAQAGPTAAEILTEDQPPVPTDFYGRSKLEAENGLSNLDLDWVALRPVLVYGRGITGNFAALVRLARSPYPLPLGGLQARRSLLSLDNLVDAVDTVLAAPGRLRRPLIVADAEALTIADMVAAMREGLRRRPGLISLPAPLLKLALQMVGRAEWYQRLACPLMVDTSALSKLGWAPRITTWAGLRNLMGDSFD